MKIMSKYRFDMVIGDETYDIFFAMGRDRELIKVPFVMIYDFVGLDAMTPNPMEHLGIWLLNRKWSKDHFTLSNNKNKVLFAGVLEDIPDTRFGIGLPNRRAHAIEYYNFTGYILPFDPDVYRDKEKIRMELGYGNEPLIICSIGGTSVGKRLLELCSETFPLIKKELPDLKMILVVGPRLSSDEIDTPEGVEKIEYIDELYKHYACCDLAIVQGGGSSTIELTALQRPFIYFPLKRHAEQELHVRCRQKRYGAGVMMTLGETSVDLLAATALENIGRESQYIKIPCDGAKKAARLIAEAL